MAAKAFEAEAEAEASHSPTLTAEMTPAGMILGTAAYVSPEQARGQPVVKSTDIWAFRAVLYEMFTGKLALILLTETNQGPVLQGKKHPAVCNAQVIPAEGASLKEIQPQIQEVMAYELDHLDEFCNDLATGKINIL